MADFWIAVGAVRENLLRMCEAIMADRPSVVKVSRVFRGALEGTAGVRAGVVAGGASFEVGFEEKRDETTSRLGSASFCLLSGLTVIGSSCGASLVGVGTALLPVDGSEV